MKRITLSRVFLEFFSRDVPLKNSDLKGISVNHLIKIRNHFHLLEGLHPQTRVVKLQKCDRFRATRKVGFKKSIGKFSNFFEKFLQYEDTLLCHFIKNCRCRTKIILNNQILEITLNILTIIYSMNVKNDLLMSVRICSHSERNIFKAQKKQDLGNEELSTIFIEYEKALFRL